MSAKGRETLLVVVTLAVIASFAGDRLILTPAIEGWKERAGRIEELEGQLGTAHALIDNEDRYKGKWQSMLEVALPEDGSEAESRLIESVRAWEKASGFQTSVIKPRRRQPDKDGQKRIELQANGQGTLEEIVKFLYELETAPIGVALEDMQITKRGDDPDDLMLNIRITGPLSIKPKEKKKTISLAGAGR